MFLLLKRLMLILFKQEDHFIITDKLSLNSLSHETDYLVLCYQ